MTYSTTTPGPVVGQPQTRSHPLGVGFAGSMLEHAVLASSQSLQATCPGTHTAGRQFVQRGRKAPPRLLASYSHRAALTQPIPDAVATMTLETPNMQSFMQRNRQAVSTTPVGHDLHGLTQFPQRLPSAPVQRRVRSVAGKTAIPADCKDFVVAGNCEVQLDDDLVVGLASMGRTQCCMMTIKWLCGEDGAECSYGAWLEERAERAGGPVEEGRACSHRRDTNASEDEQKANQNRVALLANGVKLVAYSGGQHHSVSVYQRLPGSFAMTGFSKELL
mmetsp:Transcript_11299/g.28999  ORF Transcript_11299/g.28999 Transcript_11299/m.28999 type:complete len:276 (+) Transcript_11299:306-1133(+)